jgi:dTDP-4-dehydrorhamnose 3,5-epimerase
MKSFSHEHLPEVKIITLDKFEDDRGFFYEAYNVNKMRGMGITDTFVQDNLSSSSKNVLRGLHHQSKSPQAKLVRVVKGAIHDVAVDIRKDSPTFGKWVGAYLTENNNKLLYIPPNFAHGFYVVKDAIVEYKCSELYEPNHQISIRWDDPDIDIQWWDEDHVPKEPPSLSKKDQKAISLKEYERL